MNFNIMDYLYYHIENINYKKPITLEIGNYYTDFLTEEENEMKDSDGLYSIISIEIIIRFKYEEE